MEVAVVRPSASLRGRCTVPGDKSISHRALILASQAEGESRITGLLRGEDVRNTWRVLQQLGVTSGDWGDDPLTFVGKGPAGWKEPGDVLDFGNSGTGIPAHGGYARGTPLLLRSHRRSLPPPPSHAARRRSPETHGCRDSGPAGGEPSSPRRHRRKPAGNHLHHTRRVGAGKVGPDPGRPPGGGGKRK